MGTPTGDQGHDPDTAPLTAYAPWRVVVQECEHGRHTNCGLCGGLAAFHLTVHGGARDGRLIGWLCCSCLGSSDEGAGRLLQEQVSQDMLDPVTGGPGTKGYRLPDPHTNGGQL